MGYTTDFGGSFKLSRPATEKEIEYLDRFSDTRRMKRNVSRLMELYDGKHGNPFIKGKTASEIYGKDGEFFCMNDGNSGQTDDISIVEFNDPPSTQPGLWCQWILGDFGKVLEWDGNEKFYSYVEWLEYLIHSFFEPWGIKINGTVEWYGEDPDDRGLIVVTDNEVKTKKGRIVFDE